MHAFYSKNIRDANIAPGALFYEISDASLRQIEQSVSRLPNDRPLTNISIEMEIFTLVLNFLSKP